MLIPLAVVNQAGPLGLAVDAVVEWLLVHGQGFFSLIQIFYPIGPIAAAVFQMPAENLLEKGRRNLIVLFIGLVSHNCNWI